MSLWDTAKKRLGVGQAKAAPKPSTARGRVPMPVTVGSAGGSNGLTRSGSLAFWGENIEGYDALLSGLFDYEEAIGEYSDNSAVAACLAFIISAFSACTLRVGVPQGGEFTPDESHPLLDLINKPHADYDGSWLWALLLSDYWQEGNGYWNIVRSGVTGPPVELQPLLAGLTKPIKLNEDDTRLLDHFRYQPGTASVDQPAELVIHFKYSIPDPEDMRLGLRPLRTVRREVYTDNKASEVAAALMRRPQPSGFLFPESSDIEVSQSDMDHIKRSATEASSGQNAGQVVALSAGVKWQALSFTPRELALDEVRVKPEERICAIFNIPPVVVGLGAGLKNSTYNNGETAHRAAWQNCVAPLQDYFAAVLTAKLLPMFPNSKGKVVYWDRSQVGVLQPDLNAQRKEAREDLKSGIITIEEARGEGGRPAQPTEGTLQPPQTATVPQEATQTAKGLKRAPQASNGSIYDAADRFRAALMNDEQEAIQQIASAYNRVSRDIQKSIDETIAALEENPSYSHEFALARAVALSEQVEAAMADFTDRGAAIVEDGQRKAIDTTLGHTERLTRAALGTPPPGVSATFTSLPTEALEVIVGMAGNSSPLASLLAIAGKEYATQLQEILISSVAQGIGPKEVARKMAGASGASRSRMETIARTEMLRASREASRRSYEANADIINGYIRLSAADVQTCAACWALHGTKSQLHERFPSHPGCRCSLLPDVKSYAEILGDPTIPDTRKSIPEGGTLFAQLTEAEQAEILGPALLDLYKNGASLNDFVTRSYNAEWGPTVSVSNVASASARAEVRA